MSGELNMTGHALLGPSSASRWLNCTPSARLEENYPDTAGVAAQEGTLAHELGETLIKHHHGLITEKEYLSALERISADPLYSNDMLDHADSYAAFVNEQLTAAKQVTTDAVLQIEAKLNLTDYVPEGFGTGDAVIIADGTLSITDLKYGKGVMVSCENNKQMMLYALGALREYDYLYDIHTVSMTIFQPRLDNISTFIMSVSDLRKWAVDELAPKAKLAFEGKGEFVTGDHCKFCKAKSRCKALAEANLTIAKYDFADPTLLTDAEIADILTKADAFKSWISSLEDYALAEALSGKKFEGFKLVEGRSNRCYADQDKVADTLIKNGIPEEIIYTKSLLGITAMEKAISKKTFGALLTDLVIKPQGKPALVPATDKRQEFNSAVNDFINN